MNKRYDIIGEPTLIDGRWVFPDGRVLPLVAGGDETADALDGGDGDGGGDAVERSVEMPDDLADREALDDEALAALESALEAEMDAALDAGSADVALFTAIADDITAVRAEKAEREQADTENEAAIAAQIARVRGDKADDAEGEGEEGAEDGADPAATPDATGDEEQAGDGTAEGEEVREPVTAAAPPARRTPRAPSARSMRRHADQPDAGTGATDTMQIALVAAADVPGYSNGAKMTVTDISKGLHAKARGLSNGSPRQPVAQIVKTYPDELTQAAQPGVSDLELLDRLGSSDAVNAMLAAGGWCTPHQTLFDFFTVEGADALFDLPTIGITRGGIEVPNFIGYNAADGALWTWTATNDANALAGIAISNLAVTGNVVTVDTAANHNLAVGQSVRLLTSTAAFSALNNVVVTVASVVDANTFTANYTTANVASAAAVGTVNPIKGCLRIPCPTWTDYELEAEGLCISHGNLMDRAYPELTNRYVNLAVVAHERRIAARALGKVLAAANTTAVTQATGASDGYGEILSAAEMQAMDYRSQYGASADTVVEQVYPLWTYGIIRANLAKRGGVDVRTITNAQIDAEFASRNIRAQFVRDYQEFFGGAARTDWPTTIKFLMYFAGGFFKGEGGTIDLGVVRDSTLNEENDFTAAWTESFYLVGKRGPNAREVTVTLGAADGVTACCP